MSAPWPPRRCCDSSCDQGRNCPARLTNPPSERTQVFVDRFCGALLAAVLLMVFSPAAREFVKGLLS